MRRIQGSHFRDLNARRLLRHLRSNPPDPLFQRAQQHSLRSHDADMALPDLDTLREGAQMIPPIAASMQPEAFARGAGEGAQGGRSNSHAAGVFKLCLTLECVTRRGRSPRDGNSNARRQPRSESTMPSECGRSSSMTLLTISSLPDRCSVFAFVSDLGSCSCPLSFIQKRACDRAGTHGWTPTSRESDAIDGAIAPVG